MKIYTLLFTILFSFIAVAKGHSATHKYIEQYKKTANYFSQKYKIPSSIILAIAFVETGGGTSKTPQILNNHFGLVGKNTINNSVYRSFNSPRESYEAFCKLQTKKKYYKQLKNCNDFEKWIQAIARSGYSSQPHEWKRRLRLIKRKFKL